MPRVDISNLIQTVLIYALPVVLSITVRASVQAHAARRLGDPTAMLMGRLTLNPIKHIDLIGTLVIPLAMLLLSSGKFLFGYAKPVPIDERNFRQPRRDMMWVALAASLSNFLQAFLWTVLLLMLAVLAIEERYFIEMARAGILVNLIMWAFNLFPLPPLDGGRILAGILPEGKAQYWLARVEPFGFFIVMGLAIAGVMGSYWLFPLLRLGEAAIRFLLIPLLTLVR